MRVAIISDSPTLPSGFARTTRTVIKALNNIGHEVSCFGLGLYENVFDRSLYACKIWAAGENNHESNEMLLDFLAREKPDAIIINYDLIAALRWLQFLTKEEPVDIPIISLLIIDGLPVYPQIMRPFSRCAAVIAVTQCVQAHLAATITALVYYVPHTVDCEKFRPLPDAETVRRAVFGDALVVGTIAQNRPRKQLVQTIHAIRLLRDAGRNPVFLLHTDRTNGMRYGGSPLRRVIESFGIGDIVHITESHRINDAAAEEEAKVPSCFGPSLKIDQLAHLTVVERLNLFDVAVIGSAFGGFEYGIVEAQSCGIPVCVTDDSGIMTEVAGGACEPLRPALYEFTEYGAKVWKVAPETIAAAITKIADDPAQRQELQVSGPKNAKRYDEAMNEKVIEATLGKIVGPLQVSPARQLA